MSVTEVEKLVSALPEADRARLAERLLRSLKPVADDSDEGIAEALRRRTELEANPEIAISVDELDMMVRSDLVDARKAPPLGL